MRRALRDLLLGEGGLTPEQLGLAEERQRVLGGGLDTAILELGLLPEGRLVQLLAAFADLPAAPPELLEAPEAGLEALLPRLLAEKHGIAPVSVERRQLTVLARLPIDLGVLDEISFLLSRPLRPYLTTELRVARRQARVYGQPLPERFSTLLHDSKLIEGQQPPHGALEEPVAADPPVAPPSAEPTPEAEPAPQADVIPIDGALVAAAVRSSPTDALELLRASETRDAVLATLLAYCRSAFDFVAIYARRGPQMFVFEAAGDGLEGADFDAAGLSLERPSVLRTVVEARAPYVGPVPAGDPLETALGELGRSHLRAVLLYPVVIRDRAVLVVHGDSGGEALAPRQLSDIAVVLSQAGAALERAILAQKRRLAGMRPGADGAVPSPGVLVSSGAPSQPPAAAPLPFKKRPITIRWGTGAPSPGAPDEAEVVSMPDVEVRIGASDVEPPAEVAPEEKVPARPATGDETAIGSSTEAAAVVETSPPESVPTGGGEPAAPAAGAIEAAPLPLTRRREPPAEATPIRTDEPPILPLSALGEVVDQAVAQLDDRGLQPLQSVLPRPVAVPVARTLRPDGRDALEFDLAIDWVDPEASPQPSYADLVRTFLAGKAETRADAERRLLAGGAAAAEALAARFPGPLFVFRINFDELPEPRQLGPLIGLLGSMGEVALPPLAAVADSAGEEKRFWATVLLAKMGHPGCLPALVRRVFDPAPDVAQAARRGLWSHRRQPEYARSVEQVELELGSPDPARAAQAARALGALHHVPAIPRLIDLCGSRQPEVAEAAVKALREITLQDFGSSERRWSAWWAQAKERPRASWLVEALEHRDEDLRLAAIGELAAAAGQDFGYKSDLPSPQRAAATIRWKDWLSAEGKSSGLAL